MSGVATAAAVVTAGAALAGTAYTMFSPKSGGGGMPNMPQNPAVPNYTDPSVQANADAAAAAQARAAGRSSTLLTGGQGDTSAVNTTTKTVLGG